MSSREGDHAEKEAELEGWGCPHSGKSRKDPLPWSFWREHGPTDTPALGPGPPGCERIDPCPCQPPTPRCLFLQAQEANPRAL